MKTGIIRNNLFCRKATILLLAFTGLAATQNVEITCNFYTWFGDYTCRLVGIELLDPTANVTFIGNHTAENTDANVDFIEIWDSNTPFVIEQLFSQFPSVTGLEIVNSQLQTLRIPEFANLEDITLRGNNVSRIDSNSLANQTNLLYFSAHNNSILEIDEDAFVGLSVLYYAGFINNHVSEIAPGTFREVISVRTIDFEGNNLTRIGDNIFENNRNLTILFLERNQIEAVSPTFTANLQQSTLNSVNFSGNRCAERYFNTRDEFEWMFLNAALNTCFQNFVGAEETRRFTIETSGPFILHDQFGNVVARM